MAEIKNRININGESVSFQTDTVPSDGSSAFITSGAVYQAIRVLSAFVNRNPTDVISSSNTDLITSGAVYEALSKKADLTALNSLKSRVTALESFVDGLGSNPIITDLVARIEALEDNQSE